MFELRESHYDAARWILVGVGLVGVVTLAMAPSLLSFLLIALALSITVSLLARRESRTAHVANVLSLLFAVAAVIALRLG